MSFIALRVTVSLLGTIGFLGNATFAQGEEAAGRLAASIVQVEGDRLDVTGADGKLVSLRVGQETIILLVAGAAPGEASSNDFISGGVTYTIRPIGPPVKIELGSRAMLVPGAHIVAFYARGDDGAMVASRVTVGKDGTVPPM
jgi:hypothetical protein